MSILVIAEKPSVGRDIARVLKCAQKADGYLYGGGYTVSWAFGHLVTLKEPEDYGEQYKKWRFEELPVMPETMELKAITKTRAQLNVLKKLMNDKETESIICATDSGREGELIFRYIYALTRCTKPFKRLWISSMTDAAITEGFARLRDGREYDALYQSAKCRAEADWLVGMNATRAYTVQYGALLSLGRVQTPTLAMLVSRRREIEAFVPTDYWEVKAEFSAEAGTYAGLWFDSAGGSRETAITDKQKADKIAALIKNAAGSVESAETEERRTPPPQLFDLTELQRECNRVLGFSAQKTLTLAQALYERHKLITYPRTDSRYISKDIIPKLAPAVKSLSGDYPGEAAYLLALPKLPVTARIADDAKVTDHHAIIPTGGKIPASLTPDERAVFDRVARRFLAAFYPAQVCELTAVVTNVSDERFISKGRVVLAAGWTALYARDGGDADGEGALPPLKERDAVTVTDAAVLHKKTQPPKPYTEATLLSAMEHAGRFTDDERLKEQLKESGLGTPATRAAIIERLIAVGYVERRKRQLMPTEKGVKLIGIVPEELRSPETTGKWERGLTRIAKGEADGARFMASIRRYVLYIIENAAAGDAEAKKGLFPREAVKKKAGRGKGKRV